MTNDIKGPSGYGRPFYVDRVLTWCPREESNLHALASTGPQPAAYANSATGALTRDIIRKAANLSNDTNRDW